MSDDSLKLLYAVPCPHPLWALVIDRSGQRGEWFTYVKKVTMLGCFSDNPDALEPMVLGADVYRLSEEGDVDGLFDSTEEADGCCLHWAIGTCKDVRLSDGRFFQGGLAITNAAEKFGKK